MENWQPRSTWMAGTLKSSLKWLKGTAVVFMATAWWKWTAFTSRSFMFISSRCSSSINNWWLFKEDLFNSYYVSSESFTARTNAHCTWHEHKNIQTSNINQADRNSNSIPTHRSHTDNDCKEHWFKKKKIRWIVGKTAAAAVAAEGNAEETKAEAGANQNRSE